MKEKICIVPFTENESAIYNNCPKDFEIVGLVSPKAYDLKYFKHIKNINEILYDSIEDVRDFYDTVIVSNVPKDKEELYEFAIKSLWKAIAQKKNIICYLDIDEKQYIQCKEETEKNGCYFLSKSKLSKINENILEEKYVLKEFNVPIIFIYELLPNLNGYEIFIKLLNRLQQDNFSVLAISDDIYNSIWNQYSVDFCLENLSTETINKINSLVYRYFQKKHPDVIVLKCPMPIMKYNNENAFDYGLSTYVISQAINGSVGICCTFSGTPTADFWDYINESIIHKFGFPLIGVHVEAKKLDNAIPKIVETVVIDEKLVNDELVELNKYNNVNFYNLLDSNDFEKIYQGIKSEFLMIDYGVI